MRRSAVLWIFAGVMFQTCSALALSSPKADELVESLRDDDEVTARAAEQMLVTMGSEAVRPLAKALTDANFRVRRRAAETLGLLGPQASHAAPELVFRLADPQPDVHDAAQKALYAIGDEAIPPLADALKSDQEGLRRVALSTLSGFGTKGAPAILKILKNDESSVLRADAANALGQMKNPSADVVEGLIQAFGDLQESVRSEVADALGQLGPSAKAAIGPLIVGANEDKDALTRKRAADALLRIGPAGKESLRGFIACLHDPSLEVRKEVILMMGNPAIPWNDASPVLTSALKDPDPGVRLQVLQTVVALSSASAAALPLLKQGLADASVDVRAAAIDGLGHLEGAATEAARELKPGISDANPVIRQDTIHALAHLGMAGLPGLVLALNDSYSTLSDEAGKTIIQLGPEAIPSLQTLLQTPDPDLKRRVTLLINRIQQNAETPERPRRKGRKPS